MNNRNKRKFEDLITMDLEKMREDYNKGEFDNYSYLQGYEDILNNAENYYLKASGCSRTDIEGFSKNIKSYYSDIKTGYYKGDMDEEDYYDGFSRGVQDILEALDMKDVYEEIMDNVFNKEEHDI